LYGFSIIDDANATYYALDDLNDGINSNFVLYDRNWTYLTYKTLFIYLPVSIISFNNELFITGNDGIYKTDKSLNIVGSYISTGAEYTGIYYNSTSDNLYVASYSFNRIDLFYRNLTFISTISLTNQPWTLTENNGKLYVGLIDGSISVLENNLVVKTITTLCTGLINSIVIDENELMAVLCNGNNMLYLYSTNASYTGKNMTTPLYPVFTNYDLNGNFIIAGSYQINLYY
jgi:hypothetical protein